MSKKRKKKYPVKGLDRHGRKWRWRRMVDGRQVVVTFEASSETAAIARVMEFEKHPELLRAGAWEQEVDAYIAEETARGALSAQYAKSRKNVLKKAGRDMGVDSPGVLSGFMVSGWVSGVREALNDKTANHYLLHLRQFTKWLLKRRKIYQDPCLDVDSVENDFVPRDVFIEAEKVAELIDAARVREDPELELIILLACECGMRHGEISAARAEWVDLKRGMITIPAKEKDDSWSRKGKVGRKKSVTIEMVSDLVEWFGLHGVPEPFLLRPDKAWGQFEYRYEFRKKLSNFLKANDCEGVTCHDLRRSFGSNRVSCGASIEQVANWMGIDPRTAWKYYARFIPKSGEIERGSARSAGEAGDQVAVVSVKDRLSELKVLLDEGLISKADFELKKAEILEGL